MAYEQLGVCIWWASAKANGFLFNTVLNLPGGSSKRHTVWKTSSYGKIRNYFTKKVLSYSKVGPTVSPKFLLEYIIDQQSLLLKDTSRPSIHYCSWLISHRNSLCGVQLVSSFYLTLYSATEFLNLFESHITLLKSQYRKGPVATTSPSFSSGLCLFVLKGLGHHIYISKISLQTLLESSICSGFILSPLVSELTRIFSHSNKKFQEVIHKVIRHIWPKFDWVVSKGLAP